MWPERFVRYLAARGYSPHTIRAYRTDIRQAEQFVNEQFGRSLQEVGRKELEAYAMELSRRRYRPRTLNRKIMALRALARFMEWEGRAVPWAAALEAVPVPQHLPRFMSEAEVEKLAQWIEEIPKEWAELRDKVVYLLLVTTGMRRGELMQLKTTDVDLKGRWIRVMGKGGKERQLPLLDFMAALLRRYVKERNARRPEVPHLIVTDRLRPAYPSMIYRVVRRLSYQVTGKWLSPHQLRHTFATVLLNRGVDIITLKELLGHASLAATQVYTHTSVDQLRRAVQQAHPHGSAESQSR